MLWKFLLNNKKDIFVFIFFCLFLPLFLYNLGSYSLEDFDEAWFGEIARNILINKNPIALTFNGSSFYDHPPAGYNLIAASIFLFGPTEFAVRLPSAVLGFLSLFLLYLTGKNLFGRTVGFGASLILASSVWFIFRARSGNLDTILVFFFILTFYLTIKLKKSNNYVFLLAVSFALLILTKSLVGIVMVIPVISFILINKVKIPWRKIVYSVFIFSFIIITWLYTNTASIGPFFLVKLARIGLRPDSSSTANYFDLLNSQTLTYLHYGIRKWYYPGLLSIIFTLFLTLKNKDLIPVLLWAFLLLFGYVNNSKTEIWHMLPLYPPIALLIAFTINFLVTAAVGKIKRHLNIQTKKQIATLIFIMSILPISVLTSKQIYDFRDEIKLFDTTKSGLSQSALAARGRKEDLYLDSDLPVPGVAAFYSQKHVHVLIQNPAPANNLKGQMTYGKRPFLLLTETWRLESDKISSDSYMILAEKNGHLLIKVE